MRIEASGTIEMDSSFFAEMQELAAAHWPAELKRMQNLSMISGMEVVYDLSDFDLEWSPAYRHDSDEAVAWINTKTGERREGRQSPYDGVEASQ